MKHAFLIMTVLVTGGLVIGCAKGETDPLFASCVTIGVEEQMQGWEESDRPSVTEGVRQGCEMLVKECKDNPDGDWCKASRAKFTPDR